MAGIEHMGLGLAGKAFAPRVHLVWLVLATELIDILYGVFFALGLERWGEPAWWSHSLAMAVVWSLIAGCAAALVLRSRKSGLVLGLLVMSHWVLDFITHPMLAIMPGDQGVPLVPGNPTLVGLGMYATMPGVIAGFVLFIGPGVVLLIRSRRRAAAGQTADKPVSSS